MMDIKIKRPVAGDKVQDAATADPAKVRLGDAAPGTFGPAKPAK